MKAVLNKYFFLLSIIFFFTTCKERQSPEKANLQKNSAPVTVQYKKPGSSFTDTIVIKSVSAVFFSADSLQQDKIKQIMSKELFETEVHNCFYLIRNASKVLKHYWHRVRIIKTSEVRYLLFIKADDSKVLIDLNSINDMCGVFLFDKKKDPELADMMNIDTALEFYFDK